MKKSTNKTKADTLSGTQKIGIGVGLTAAIAAAAGSYFLYGSQNAAKNRTMVKSWSLKAKSEVLEAIEQAKEMSKDDYNQLIATVAGAYSDVQNVSKKELGEFTKEMKEHWSKIEKTASKKKSPAKKMAVKKTAAKKAPAKKMAVKQSVVKKAAVKKSK